MSNENLLLILGLLFTMTLLYMLSQKIRVPYPIFLVVAGLVISVLPFNLHVNISPDLIFTIFLPPILYEAAWNTIWNEFWRLRRPIMFMAFGLVVFTSVIVAYISVWLIPGFTLALGFLLGGIISPPDAASTISLLRNIKMPQNVLTILEGESLMNDASSLIVIRFATLSVVTGQFSLSVATANFFLVAVMGVIIGISIAAVIYLIHRFLPTTPSIDTVFTFIAPYIMYITAEHFDFSGVLAVVSGGLFLSYRSQDILSSVSRLQTGSVWETVIFLLNGVIFILIGLELPAITSKLTAETIQESVKCGIIISALIIVVRILWVYPSAYIPILLDKKIKGKEVELPSPKTILIIGWSGMRGIVSLASALAVPLVLQDSAIPFPFRDMVLLITFVVILITLVFQGFSLPFLIRILKVDQIANSPGYGIDQGHNLQLHMAQIALDYLHRNYSNAMETNFRLNNYKLKLEKQISRIESNETIDLNGIKEKEYESAYGEVIKLQRNELRILRKDKIYSEKILRKYERTLDIKEANLFNKLTI